MSYDVKLYTVLDPRSAAENVLFEAGFEREGIALAAEIGGSHVVFSDPDPVEPEDMEPAVHAALPGLRFLVSIHIEGGTTEKALRKVRKASQAIAKLARGVVVDEQDGTMSTPRGVRRLPAHEAPADLDGPELSISWWFDDPARLVDGCSAFYALIERYLPEALPRRYGLHEPPAHKLADTGREHFVSFLRQHLLDGIVWYPSKPFTHVGISIPDRVGPTRRGFRAAHIQVRARPDLLRVPGWPTELRDLWLAIGGQVASFYSEIRSGESPVKVWWWNGIPAELPMAVQVGDPYLDLWHDFGGAASTSRSGLRYLERVTGGEPLSLLLGEVPPGIRQPLDRCIELDPLTGNKLSEFVFDDIRYPEKWPFAGPRLDG